MNNVFKEFTGYWCKWDWAVVCGYMFFSRIQMHSSSLEVFRQYQGSIAVSAADFRTWAGILSEPVALWNLRSEKSLCTTLWLNTNFLHRRMRAGSFGRQVGLIFSSVCQWRSQNAEKSTHIKWRLLVWNKQWISSLIVSLFKKGTSVKGKNLLPEGANSFL